MPSALLATTTLRFDNTTEANFRTWGLAVSTKFGQAGWVKTTDTGQINWATITIPVTVNVAMGYEIWRMADALQATAPVFMKIEYGGASPVTIGSVWFTFGSGSDGAGALTGILTNRQQVVQGAQASAVTTYWCGDTHRFALVQASGSSNQNHIWSIERTVDGAGTPTGEAVLLLFKQTASAILQQLAWNCTTGPVSAWEQTPGIFGPSLGPFGTAGSQVAVYPCFHNKGVFYPHGLNLMGYFDATITAAAMISFPVYGATHTYMPLGSSNLAGFFRTAGGTQALMVRYS